jgi:hypothetical protein
MKKIDFEKMEKIEGGKLWKEPQIISTAKKNQQSEANSNVNAIHNKTSLKSNC